MVQSLPRPQAVASLLTVGSACTVLTPSGTVIARGHVAPRRQEHLPEAYAFRLSEIDPPGVLEALVYASQPYVVLRTTEAPSIQVRIDHVTGPRDGREFYCHMA